MGEPSLAKKENCTGCGACAAVCPADAVTLVPDGEGFQYPVVGDSCTECKACEGVCPALNPVTLNPKPDAAYAAWLRDGETRRGSSSGGFFRVLVRYVLDRGGVVFGAAFDAKLRLKHQSAETERDCEKFYGSKYVQSETSEAYRELGSVLDAGRWALFSGTPCQVAGLYAYLGGDRERLITCDLVCTGVPSPAVFRKYIDYLESERGSEAVDMRFKDKSLGWHKAHYAVDFADGGGYRKPANDTEYGRAFGSALFLRPSCGSCAYAKPERPGDFTLGDFWGIGKEIPFPHDTEKGVSLVLFNSQKARDCKLPPIYESVERPVSEALTGNPRLTNPVAHSPKREAFFKAFRERPFTEVMAAELKMPGLAYRLLAKATPEKLKKMIRG